MREQDAERESRTAREPGRATPEAIARVARILRRRRNARRERERAELASRPVSGLNRPL